MDKYPEEFIQLCLQNGLDPNDQKYGSKTVSAYFWFGLGREVEKERIKKAVDKLCE